MFISHVFYEKGLSLGLSSVCVHIYICIYIYIHIYIHIPSPPNKSRLPLFLYHISLFHLHHSPYDNFFVCLAIVCVSPLKCHIYMCVCVCVCTLKVPEGWRHLSLVACSHPSGTCCHADGCTGKLSTAPAHSDSLFIAWN